MARGWTRTLAIGFLQALAIGLSTASSLRAQQIAPANAADRVDASTLKGKTLCGYQGWFRCPGDSAGKGWRHWSRRSDAMGPQDPTFELWPDLSGFDPDERFPAPGFHFPSGAQAELFSSVHPKTVERHFRWMRDYGIDGVFLQRFLVSLRDPSSNTVLANVRDSAHKFGRIYAICYDLSGYRSDRIVETLERDWQALVTDLKITRDPGYLHENGKPLVFVWGLYPDRFGPEIAHRVIDLFKSDTPLEAVVVGGCPWYWRNEKNPEWARAYRRLDVLSPWNVGNYASEQGVRIASTRTWQEDRDECAQSGMTFLPVVYPGFAWSNLKGKGAERARAPRLKGEFFKRQFRQARALGLSCAYVAMFDEVDEGTAIFKVTNAPPVEAKFADLEGLPADAYLKLTGEGSRFLRGEKVAGW